MNNFDQHLRNITEHDRHHYLFGKTSQAIDYLSKYYQKDSCITCYPLQEPSSYFITFWTWFSTFQPAILYSQHTLRRFEKLSNFEIYQIPDQLLNHIQKTNQFVKDPLADVYNSETLEENLQDDNMAQDNNQNQVILLIDPDDDN
ncbi:12572_t:CDS:2 [Dentiscutata erythropus]|uniref:12572_t:CDS:1 n=1 Tax=Dentiscutata erythropus TaxID=1348616 RepID=A0A9N9IR92_9GLOM|nr:12572_t:CDS:2 [Dentiscutata erythropus]